MYTAVTPGLRFGIVLLLYWKEIWMPAALVVHSCV